MPRSIPIWLVPERKGLTPSYEQKAFSLEERKGRFRLVASPDGRDGSLTICQDARLYLATLAEGESVAHTLAPVRHVWLQVLRGTVVFAGRSLAAGDGAAISGEERVEIQARGNSEVLLFDLA